MEKNKLPEKLDTFRDFVAVLFPGMENAVDQRRTEVGDTRLCPRCGGTEFLTRHGWECPDCDL